MWFDRFTGLASRSHRIALAITLPLGLSACGFAPLYGGTGAGLERGSVLVEPVDERVAQRVRNALIEDLGAPRRSDPLVLSLDVATTIDLSLTDVGVNRTTAGTAIVTTRYRLSDVNGTLLREGRERAAADFDAPQQELARQRAIRDAENRAAREAANQIRLAIAPVVAGVNAPVEADTGATLSPLPERDPAR